MDRYEFKVKLCEDRCVKMFLNSIEMKTLDFHSLQYAKNFGKSSESLWQRSCIKVFG